MSNRLSGQSSRYLQQHADNPVAWYPWCEEALERARREDRPIFLSIGYSACHWCHVMAHESFGDEATAAILNEHFVSIKVDREERPDLDRIYMGFVQASTGSGGWPMSVFLTPEGVPFYGGTYFPKVARYNMPAFGELLRSIADDWVHSREGLLRNSDRVISVLSQQQSGGETSAGDGLDPATLEQAYHALNDRYDPHNGGWGGAPKFPQPMILEFLLRHHHSAGDPQALEMVTTTLEAMARGGLYDQLGGGFHRYSVDAHWLVPHFEKMLYDNAQLARVYLHAWQVLDARRTTIHDARFDMAGLFRAVVEETLDYVIREMTCVDAGVDSEQFPRARELQRNANDQQLRPGPQLPGNASGVAGFYATQDADSEGEEGRFFVWTPDQIREALGGPATRFLELYGVTAAGNFEGRNILTYGGSVEERQAIAGARRRLLEVRRDREAPGRDEKIVTSWNGLMLAAFAEAAVALDRDDYLRVAERNAGFLLRELRDADGRLRHVWKDGVVSMQGFLEDYTHLIEGLLALYEATFDPRWFTAAVELADAMLRHFPTDDGAGLYDTADDAEQLVVRPRDVQDNAVPSGNAMAATVLLKLAGLTGDPHYADAGRRMLAGMAASGEDGLLGQHPLGFGQWLQALSYASSRPREIAIVGDPAAADTQALLDIVRDGYSPFQVVALGAPEADPAVPLLRHRALVEGHAAAYVCRDSVCQAPAVTPDGLRAQLGA